MPLNTSRVSFSSTLILLLVFVDSSKDFLMGFIPAIFATLAFAMGLSANLWCETIKFDPTVTSDAVDSDYYDSLSFGVWYQQKWVVEDAFPNRVRVSQQCVQYPDQVSFDSKWKTAKAFSIITPVIGGFLLFFLWLSPCLYIGDRFWKQAGVIFILFLTPFQGLTLLFIDSDACKDNIMIPSDGLSYEYPEECSWDWGTRVNIAAVVFWFVTGCILMVVSPPVRPPRDPAETQTVTYTQTAQPDGTVAVTEAVVKGTYVPDEKEGPADAADGGDIEK